MGTFLLQIGATTVCERSSSCDRLTAPHLFSPSSPHPPKSQPRISQTSQDMQCLKGAKAFDLLSPCVPSSSGFQARSRVKLAGAHANGLKCGTAQGKRRVKKAIAARPRSSGIVRLTEPNS
mmetsp:Transcript_6840/g.10778  ORF Transcript_6840/g.10778 Transcript_6840/m.10778 type:complete len:121 (+) Transcript_6840:121-483(+)